MQPQAESGKSKGGLQLAHFLPLRLDCLIDETIIIGPARPTKGGPTLQRRLEGKIERKGVEKWLFPTIWSF